jgi:hypothetical protein
MISKSCPSGRLHKGFVVSRSWTRVLPVGSVAASPHNRSRFSARAHQQLGQTRLCSVADEDARPCSDSISRRTVHWMAGIATALSVAGTVPRASRAEGFVTSPSGLLIQDIRWGGRERGGHTLAHPDAGQEGTAQIAYGKREPHSRPSPRDLSSCPFTFSCCWVLCPATCTIPC